MGFLFSLFIFMPLLFLLAHSSPFIQPLCHHDESSALLQFKKSFIIDDFAFLGHGDCQKVASWKVEGNKSDCCSWDGVECDEATGHVIGLDLSASCLYGSINSNNSLFRLVYLQSLNLAYNDFNDSQIPFGVGNLLRLTHLNLSRSYFSGQIPSGVLLHLSKLSSLDLSFNYDLYAESDLLRSFAQNFTSLEELLLSYVNISSVVLESLTNLSSLTTLDLESCELQGEFPTRIFQLPNLRDLNIGWNENLTGQLPEFPSNSSLEVLRLGGTSFYGNIPSSLSSNMTHLTGLSLSRNNLKGNFSSPLSVLQLRRNNFHGTIPKTWSKGSSLQMIDLSENQFQGQLPKSMANCMMLEYLLVGNNQINGTFPFWLVCNLSSLHVLDLSYNNLSGMLHPCLGNFSSPLSVLQLRRNNFHGTIPKTWSKGSNLQMIDFSENQFQGQLPRSMANCIMLKYLHVGNNQINDTFPFWLGTPSRLKVLVLRSNGFHGAIKSPAINYTFPELHIIDLSQNSFSGNLPVEYFLQWNAMKVVGANQLKYMEVDSRGGGLVVYVQYQFVYKGEYLNYKGGGLGGSVQCTITITNKGIKLKYEKIPDVFRVIDFSSNKFEGEIPEVVGSLKGLHLLNLFNNSFSGYIPPTLQNLTHIESMDLSQNKLFGEIPPQLTQLFSLEYFNVSNNRLTGPIPHGNQFNTFDNRSFGGNPGLCGSPLSKKCGDFNYTPTPPPFEENQSSESPFEFGWKVVAIGYGCGFVIGVVVGRIVITRKYDWFVKIFGRM